MTRLNGEGTQATKGALRLFRSRHMELDESIDQFGTWLAEPGAAGAALGVQGSTAKVYASAVRSTLVKMLILQQPTEQAMQSLGSCAGTAWRLFLAYLRRPAAPGGGLGVIPDPVLRAVRRRVQTALGDKLEAQGIGWCIRVLRPLVRPSDYANFLLGNVLWRSSERNDQMFSLFIQNPRRGTSRLDGANPAQLHGAIYMALWSWAGVNWARATYPLLRTAPAFVAGGPEDEGRYRVPGTSNGMWDVCGRDATGPPPLPPEGLALLAGEAIDLAGVTPLSNPEDVANMKGLWSRRWSGGATLTVRDQVIERLDLAAFHGQPIYPEALGDVEDASRLLDDLAREGLTTRWVDAEGRTVAFAGDPGGGTTPVGTQRAAAPAASVGWTLAVEVAGVRADGEEPANEVPAPMDLTAREDGKDGNGVWTEVAVPEGFDPPELPSL